MRRGLSGVIKRVLPQHILVGVAGVLVLCGLAAQLPGLLRPQTPSNAGRVLTVSTQAQSPVSSPPDCSRAKCIALTFDDGPNTKYTPRVLSTLRQEGVQATFFLVGSRVAGREALVRQMVADGHEVGNHSWSHRKLTQLKPAQIRGEFERTQQIIVRAGAPVPTLFRPPYGAINSAVIANIPVTLALWNIDPEDWRLTEPKQLVAHIVGHAQNGRVILLHDTDPVTADALAQTIRALKARHYHIVTFSQLFDLSANTPTRLYGR